MFSNLASLFIIYSAAASLKLCSGHNNLSMYLDIYGWTNLSGVWSKVTEVSFHVHASHDFKEKPRLPEEVISEYIGPRRIKQDLSSGVFYELQTIQTKNTYRTYISMVSFVCPTGKL